MRDSITYKFELHKKWVDTIGMEGEKLILDEVDLRNINLSDKIFEQAHLFGCNFDGLTLESFDFHASILCSSTYRNSNLNNCDFYKADLSYTDFSDSVIKNVRFSKCDFWESIFRNTSLDNCNLINAYFYLTDLSNASLNNVDISMATFEEALLNGVKLRNIYGIKEAHFKSINIGTIQEPIILESAKAREWILNNC